MLCKTETATDASGTALNLATDRTGSQTKTFTATQTYNTLYLTVNYISAPSGNSVSSRPSDYWSGNGSVTISVWNNTVISETLPSESKTWNKTVKLSNVSSGSVISITLNNPWFSTTSRPWATRYQAYSANATLTISPNQSTIIKPLIPTEIQEIGKQATGMSFGRMSNGKRYGEFDGEVYSDAVTWSITLWNCLWYKIITDNNWEKYKIPIYWV